MGMLIAKKYPTLLFARLADHTYVECGTGAKAWGCWGGKTGGAAFNSGTGSTRRADAIAGAMERAGITCYLINGVCHQAANRILLPSDILVSDARGYAVSSAMFGTYGKTGFRPCHAPFNRFPEVSGDLPECADAPRGSRASRSAADRPVAARQAGEPRHLNAVRQRYARFESTNASPLESMAFQVELFEKEAEFRLGADAARQARGLRLAKEKVEIRHHALVEGLQQQDMGPADFIKAFNQLTLDFQDDMANAVSATQYGQLMRMDRDERVLLADPKIITRLYGKAVTQAVYGDV